MSVEKRQTMKWGIFIPCYNVSQQIESVLRAIPADISRDVDKIYIIDNGSKDDTVAKCLNFAQQHLSQKIFVYQNSENYLLGGSTVIAFHLAQNDDLDYLVCLHGDGQGNPEDLYQFKDAFKEDRYDFVLGSRFLRDSEVEEYSKSRYFVNLIFAYFQQLLIGERVYDLGAYIGFNMKTIKRLPFQTIEADMGYHPYLILAAKYFLKRPLRFKEFPIRWGAVETSNVNPTLYALKHIKKLITLYINGPQLKKQAPALKTNCLFPSTREVSFGGGEAPQN